MANSHDILDAAEIDRVLKRMTHEILEVHKGTKKLALVGIHTRGVHLARRIQALIKDIEGKMVSTGDMDITLYRDDWTQIGHSPVVQATDIPFDVEDKHIVLVDDVLFTGRTIRAALDALMDFGRPARIELAVLVDRGHRELPIQGNYTGTFVKTRITETVNVLLSESDGEDRVEIQEG